MTHVLVPASSSLPCTASPSTSCPGTASRLISASKYESAWTWLPNSLYDPAHGHELYNRYLDELVLADELGFDGVCVNEHHQNAYGTMPSPNLMGGDPRPANQAGKDRRHRQRPAAL